MSKTLLYVIAILLLYFFVIRAVNKKEDLYNVEENLEYAEENKTVISKTENPNVTVG